VLKSSLPARRAAAAVAVLAATACSAAVAAGPAAAGPVASARLAAAASPATAGSSPATIPNCRVGAWAEEFTDTGRLSWRISLPGAASLAYGEPAAPLAVGDVSVFPDGDSLYALQLASGRTVWHRAFGAVRHPVLGAVAGLWSFRGSVIALLGADGDAPELVSLDAATGAVHWTARLGRQPLEFGTLAVTSDGAAVVNTGTQGTTLTAVDLTAGRRLWSHAYAKTPLVQAAGTTVVISSKTSGESPVTLTGVRGRSGAPLWSRTGFPNWVSIMSAPGGRVLVDGINVIPPAPPRQPAVYPVIALSAATGRTLWQVKTARQVTAIWPASAGVVIATGLAGQVYVQDPTARLYLASLATGKVRWAAAGHTDPETTPVISSSGVITVATTPATGTVIDHSARSGAATWRAVITGAYGRYLAQPAGPDVLVAFPPASAGQPSRLLALDAATGVTRATDFLPYTAMVGAPITVAGHDALLEPEAASCAVPVAPGTAP
jgi:outer membrane protein assembly factor BamB